MNEGKALLTNWIDRRWCFARYVPRGGPCGRALEASWACPAPHSPQHCPRYDPVLSFPLFPHLYPPPAPAPRPFPCWRCSVTDGSCLGLGCGGDCMRAIAAAALAYEAMSLYIRSRWPLHVLHVLPASLNILAANPSLTVLFPVTLVLLSCSFPLQATPLQQRRRDGPRTEGVGEGAVR